MHRPAEGGDFLFHGGEAIAFANGAGATDAVVFDFHSIALMVGKCNRDLIGIAVADGVGHGFSDDFYEDAGHFFISGKDARHLYSDAQVSIGADELGEELGRLGGNVFLDVRENAGEQRPHLVIVFIILAI